MRRREKCVHMSACVFVCVCVCVLRRGGGLLGDSRTG